MLTTILLSGPNRVAAAIPTGTKTMQDIVTVPTFIHPHRKVLFPVSKRDSSGNKTRCLQKNHGFLSYLILKRCLPQQLFISNDNNGRYIVLYPICTLQTA
jgi:hypothetical protein